ncbi:MAG: hypothetical protein AAGL96_04840, partial [Pseudomonadota bacterium]
MLRRLVLAMVLIWPLGVAAEDSVTVPLTGQNGAPSVSDLVVGADGSINRTVVEPYSFSVSRMTLSAFPSGLMTETQVRSAEFSLDIIVPHRSGSGSVPGDDLNEITQTVTRYLRVRTNIVSAPTAAPTSVRELPIRVPQSIAILPSGTDIGSVSAIARSTMRGSSSTTIRLSGNADVSGPFLNQFERTLMDNYVPVSIPAQLVYYNPSATVQASNWQSVSFLPRIGFVYIGVSLIVFLAALYGFLRIVIPRPNAYGPEDEIQSLRFELEEAQRKVRISEDVAEDAPV